MLQKQNHTMESLALVMAEDSSATSLNRKIENEHCMRWATSWDSQNEQRGAEET